MIRTRVLPQTEGGGQKTSRDDHLKVYNEVGLESTFPYT
jgi:hypothetical protein